MKQYVAYYRVSTQKQGLGLEAQEQIVSKFLNGKPLAKSYVEKESGSKSDRPELQSALSYCTANNATLVVAKLDRLSRDLHFITCLEKQKVDFVCCDFPNMDRLQLHIMGSLAQWEREQISKRTSQALQALKAKGKKLGAHNPKVAEGLKRHREKMKAIQPKIKPKKLTSRQKSDSLHVPMIKVLRGQGFSLKRIAEVLQAAGTPLRQGGVWSACQVHRIATRNNI